MNIDIPDNIASVAEINEQEALQFLALSLYEKNRLSFGYASRLCHMSQSAFMDFMHKHGVNLNYTLQDLEDDMETLNSLDLPGLQDIKNKH